MKTLRSVANWHVAFGLLVAVACSRDPLNPGASVGGRNTHEGATHALGASPSGTSAVDGSAGAKPTDGGAGAMPIDGATGAMPIDAGSPSGIAAGSGGATGADAADAVVRAVDCGSGGASHIMNGTGGVPARSDSGVVGAGGAPVARAHKRVFITHGRWDGNLKLGALSSFNIVATTGLAAGDALCKWVALDAALGGVWVAWLSDSAHDAIDRIQDVGPWYRMDGVEVFHDKAALSGNPLVAVDLDETGQHTEAVVDPDGIAQIPWTGTLANGTRSPDDCRDWSANASAVVGLVGSNTATTSLEWSQLSSPACNRPYHLYCFEQ